MLRRFAKNVKRPSQTEPNMSALVTTDSLEADATEGSGVIHLVVVAVTVVTMGPARAGTNEVSSLPSSSRHGH